MYQSGQVPDLTRQPGSTCDFATGAGISGAGLDEEQKELLLELIDNRAGIADEATAAAELTEIEARLGETWISWSGATAYDTTTDNGIAFSISGADLCMKFAHQNQPGDTGGLAEPMIGWQHVHTICRDPAGDCAGTVEQEEATGGRAPAVPGLGPRCRPGTVGPPGGRGHTFHSSHDCSEGPFVRASRGEVDLQSARMRALGLPGGVYWRHGN